MGMFILLMEYGRIINFYIYVFFNRFMSTILKDDNFDIILFDESDNTW